VGKGIDYYFLYSFSISGLLQSEFIISLNKLCIMILVRLEEVQFIWLKPIIFMK